MDGNPKPRNLTWTAIGLAAIVVATIVSLWTWFAPNNASIVKPAPNSPLIGRWSHPRVGPGQTSILDIRANGTLTRTTWDNATGAIVEEHTAIWRQEEGSFVTHERELGLWADIRYKVLGSPLWDEQIGIVSVDERELVLGTPTEQLVLTKNLDEPVRE